MKYSELMGRWLVEAGYTHCFFVAGGGIMHLLDGLRNQLQCIPVVHEMSAGICAEHFNECAPSGQRALALVTTGPGLTNIVTAVAGCYVEHRQLLVLAGQVKSTDLLSHPQRQRGVQEVDGSGICAPVAVRCERLTAPLPRDAFLSAIRLARGPHPGPVVMEVCLDVQGASVDESALCTDGQQDAALDIPPAPGDIQNIRALLQGAQRPLLLLGGLVSRQAARAALPALERLGLPVATTTSAIDRVPTDSPIFAGRPGTWGGQRAANLIMAQADVVIALGAQLDLQQTGFNYAQYAPEAQLVHVFPSEVELSRVGPPACLKVCASPDQTLRELMRSLERNDPAGWQRYVQEVRSAVPSLESANVAGEGFINSFEFLRNLSRASDARDILALCSSGGTFTGALQNYEIASGQTATTSAAHASMGYGLATAMGAAFANPGRRVILTEGEGGFSQNLQELAIVQRHDLPIKIFLIDNQGYASIRATQRKFFGGAYVGCDPDTGLGFPHWVTLFEAYGIPCRHLGADETDVDTLQRLLGRHTGPEAWIVKVDPEQSNWPAVSTTLASDGSMVSSPLYDMRPPLPADVLAKVGRHLPGSVQAYGHH
jgi:acetolactate synthase-1/2/3 large subunit